MRHACLLKVHKCHIKVIVFLSKYLCTVAYIVLSPPPPLSCFISVCRFLKGNVWPKFAHCFILLKLKKVSFSTSCVFWFVFLNDSSHLCFRFGFLNCIQSKHVNHCAVTYSKTSCSLMILPSFSDLFVSLLFCMWVYARCLQQLLEIHLRRYQFDFR